MGYVLSQGQVEIMLTGTPRSFVRESLPSQGPGILCFPVGILDLTSGLYLILIKFYLVYSN